MKDERRLRIGLLGCGPIAQAAHLDAIRKACNADLYAICDVARDLTARIAAIYQPDVVYQDFASMLADPHVEAVVIAVADQFQVPLRHEALTAGKHVLIEKRIGTTVDEFESLSGDSDNAATDAWAAGVFESGPPRGGVRGRLGLDLLDVIGVSSASDSAPK
jgi:hypothetical protein